MVADTIRAITELLRVIKGFFKKEDEPDEHTEGLDDFAELKKDDPDDPTMFVRVHKRKK